MAESWQGIEQPAFFVIANVANYGASATKPSQGHKRIAGSGCGRSVIISCRNVWHDQVDTPVSLTKDIGGANRGEGFIKTLSFAVKS